MAPWSSVTKLPSWADEVSKRPSATVARGTLVALLLSVGLLGLAARSLPLSTAYIVWTGIGALGTVIGGILLGTEPVNMARLLCLALILIGMLGLKFSG